MKIINTRLHGIFDYSAGLILILPWITGYFQNGRDTWILGLAGLATILLSVFTDYELGLIKVFPMKVHLFVDVLSALFLISMPFILPMVHYYLYWPVFLGIGELIIILLSSSKAYVRSRYDMNITKPA